MERKKHIVIAEKRKILPHIYYCELLSENRKVIEKYGNIFEDNVMKHIEVYKRFEDLRKRFEDLRKTYR
jgi:hypothetical protein